MDLKLSAIQVFVSDWQKAKDWYRDILGMKLMGEYPEIKAAWMKMDNVDFYIETPNLAWGEGWDSVKVGGRTPIIFKTKNIKKMVKELKQKGVKFVEEVSKRPWGECKAVFRDPDGNEINLVQLGKNK